MALYGGLYGDLPVDSDKKKKARHDSPLAPGAPSPGQPAKSQYSSKAAGWSTANQMMKSMVMRKKMEKQQQQQQQQQQAHSQTQQGVGGLAGLAYGVQSRGNDDVPDGATLDSSTTTSVMPSSNAVNSNVHVRSIVPLENQPVGVLDFPMTIIEDEYNPMRPNDYDSWLTEQMREKSQAKGEGLNSKERDGKSSHSDSRDGRSGRDRERDRDRGRDRHDRDKGRDRDRDTDRDRDRDRDRDSHGDRHRDRDDRGRSRKNSGDHGSGSSSSARASGGATVSTQSKEAIAAALAVATAKARAAASAMQPSAPTINLQESAEDAIARRRGMSAGMKKPPPPPTPGRGGSAAGGNDGSWAAKMMGQMGWQEGKGIGKSQQGMATPLMVNNGQGTMGKQIAPAPSKTWWVLVRLTTIYNLKWRRSVRSTAK
ncbi:hypothetical protein, variant [Sphaeroforma arctica JP610]|uniref:G-patch domain-containing protein n=1 Tax=Sphaeroforma arctica JP610 TaxID=667725 RepID=A0A0L0FHT3_9EUKA|nr:hypothetical protein, variant [Sphaeroforma arctica JP610]KNC76320.1 hypothetical protein, variant [Sphaeroforma arctica JP610]|eukprot:XP_014150222.1 hypothetical protein, variant [Sphaeroforma arctica JP610]